MAGFAKRCFIVDMCVKPQLVFALNLMPINLYW